MNSPVSTITGYLQKFLGGPKPILPADTNAFNPGSIPNWISQLVEIYETSLGEQTIVLIAPKEDLTVDQGARIYSVIRETLKRPTLLIADRLPPKGRGTLVRLRIPHVVSNHSIYSPELGLQYKTPPKKALPLRSLRPKLPIAAVKIAMHFLLNPKQQNKKTTLGGWVDLLKEAYGIAPSLSTSSRAFIELMQNGLVEIDTIGTSKNIQFLDRHTVWKQLVACSGDLIQKRLNLTGKPNDSLHIKPLLSGESALAAMSDLSEPRIETIAIDSSEWHRWSQDPINPPQTALLDRECIHVEVWPLAALTFPKNKEHPGYVNPIALALNFRGAEDPRIQESVQQMLGRIDLDASLLWSQR